jgi:hypothetical protein
MAATLLFLSNIWFWHSTGDYFGTAAEFEPLLHTWSLAVEEQFYIFFPPLLWVLARYGRGLFVPVIVGLSVLSFAGSIWATGTFPLANFFLTPSRIWELGLGALLALGAAPQRGSRLAVESAGLFGLALIVAAIFLLTPESPFPGLLAVPPCFGAALLIWAGGQGGSFANRLLALPVFVGIGLISYSLYLWHWPILVAARVVLNSVHLPLAVAWGAVLLSVVLACLSWRFVERPFRSAGPEGIPARVIFGASLGYGAVLAGAAGATILADGFRQRLPAPELATYLAALEKSDLEVSCIRIHPSKGLCEFGAAPSPRADFLLWGDSHAGAILPGVDAWLDDNGKTALAAVKTGCPPLWGLVRADMETTHHCDRFNDAVLEMLESRDDLETVILMARWAMAFEGSRGPGDARPGSVLTLSSLVSDPVEATDNAALAEYGLRTTVQRILETGRKVVILQGTPEIGFQVPEAVLSAAFLGTPVPPGPSRRDVETRHRRVNALIQDLATDPRVQSLSLVPALCAPECAIELNGIPIYRDSHHLNLSGAMAIIPPVLEQMTMN